MKENLFRHPVTKRPFVLVKSLTKKKNFTKHGDWTNWWETLKIFLILSKVKTRFQALPKFCGVAKVDVNFGQRRLKRERSDELYQQTGFDDRDGLVP